MPLRELGPTETLDPVRELGPGEQLDQSTAGGRPPIRPRGRFSSEGAPAQVRAMVGAAPNAESRLATLRQFYPDAQVAPGLPDNFTFTNERGELTLYNPTGLDLGDLASLPREAGQFIGSTAGAIGGGVLGAAGGPPGMIAGGMLGAGAGQAVGDEAAIGVMRAFGMEDLRSGSEIAGNAISNVAFGSLGEGAGAAVGFAGRRGLEAIGSAMGPAARAGQAAFRRVGGSPTLGQALRGNAILAFETIMSRFPGGAGPLARRARETVGSIQEFVERTAAGVARRRTSPEIAGRTIETGIEGFVQRFKTRGGQMFTDLVGEIPSQQLVALDAVGPILKELSSDIPGAPNISGVLANPTVRNLAGAVGEDAVGFGQVLPYAALEAMRSSVGRRLASFDLVSDIPRAELKRIYAALTSDMRGAAAEAGGDVLARFNRANQFWNAGIDRIEGVLTRLANRGTPEEAFRAAMAGTADGATRLRALRRSLTAEEWTVVVGTTIRRLGRGRAGSQDPTGELFSTETFLTNWASLSREAKDALFEGPGLPRSLRADLDSVAEISEIIRRSGEMFRNPSGTSGATVGQAMMLGGSASVATGVMFGETVGIKAAVGLAMAGLGANAASRLMTSPAFVGWWARGQRVAMDGFGAHLGRLGAIAVQSEDPELRDAIVEFLGTIGEATGETTARLGTPVPPNIPPPLGQPPLAAIPR